MNYYNEFDPKAAAWLRQLISAGEIPNGHVDERSICGVRPEDIEGYTQCHFFAGIGGWSYALKLAGWPPDRVIWTMSCPCQPFSTAGKQRGNADERHLWPVAFNLIRQCRPERVFGEQVASAIGHGWLDGISADLESENYTCGETVLGAHSVGAPHIRQRLYWVADAKSGRLGIDGGSSWGSGHAHECGETIGLGLTDSAGRDSLEPSAEASRHGSSVESTGGVGGMGHAYNTGSQGRIRQELRECSSKQTAGPGGAWSDYELVQCLDGKSRRIESGTFPLAHGVSGRVGLLRGYGNAIIPQVAAEFIGAFLDIENQA